MAARVISTQLWPYSAIETPCSSQRQLIWERDSTNCHQLSGMAILKQNEDVVGLGALH